MSAASERHIAETVREAEERDGLIRTEFAEFIDGVLTAAFHLCGEIECDQIFALAADAGMMEQVEFDSAKHPQVEADPGDIIWALTEKGKQVRRIARGQR